MAKLRPWTKHEALMAQELASQGATNKEIAAKIGRSEGSISTKFKMWRARP